MTQSEEHTYKFETLQLHGGQTPDKATKARAVPIYASTSFTFDSTQDIDDMLHFKKQGYFYSR